MVPLAADPGTQWAYSNVGYIFVGTMLERKTGKTWDELITERIFRPLGLKTAGLAPSLPGQDRRGPWGTSMWTGNSSHFWQDPTATISP
jgi:CubicO group peptidase (beta-lactamase class C family)